MVPAGLGPDLVGHDQAEDAIPADVHHKVEHKGAAGIWEGGFSEDGGE